MSVRGLRDSCWRSRGALRAALAIGVFAWLGACQQRAQPNQAAAQAHAKAVVEQAVDELASLRARVPRQAARLSTHWGDGADLVNNPGAVRSELRTVAGKRHRPHFNSPAYFAIAQNGVVVRNDQPVDELAGTDLYRYLPQLRTDTRQYREAVGNLGALMASSAAADGQWIAMAGLQGGGGTSSVQLVAGVSLGMLAHHLERTLRDAVRREQGDHSTENMPLLYCFLLVGSSVYTGPLTPAIHTRVLGEMNLADKVSAVARHVETIRVEQRAFALAVESFTALAPNAAIGVLRSET